MGLLWYYDPLNIYRWLKRRTLWASFHVSQPFLIYVPMQRSIADVVNNEKRLEMQQSQLIEKTNKLDQQALQALQANREDLARMALQRKETLLVQINSYEQQLAQLKAQEEKLISMERTISARVEAFRTQKEMVKAQYNAAQAQVK